MEDCIFCKIIKGDIPSELVYSDEFVVAIRDIHPVAPVHVLILPRKHFANLSELAETDPGELGSILAAVARAAKKIAELEGIADKGYRLINNCGQDAGQTVMHLHFHLIGGKTLGEKLI